MGGILESMFPRVAQRRAEARLAAAAADARAANLRALQSQIERRSAFKAAETNRLNANMPRWTGDLNTWLLTQLPVLRARSRWLCANNPYASSAIGMLCNYVVGTGMVPQAATRYAEKQPDGTIRLVEREAWNDYVDDLWQEWADNVDVTAGPGEESGWWEFQSVVLRRLFEDGEVFIRLLNPKDWPVVPFASEILMPEWVNTYIQKDSQTGNRIVAGIELDRFGRKVAYHFQKAQPDGTSNFASDVRIPATDIIHIFIRHQPRQLRGVPLMVPVLERFYSLDEYADFELISAKIAACFGAFITRPPGDKGDILNKGDGSVAVRDAEGNELTTVEPGMIANLPEGYGVTFAQPQKPGATFDMFTTFHLRALGAGIEGGLSYESLTRDTSRSTFAGGRLAQIMDYQTYRNMQMFLEKRLGVPYRRRWLEAAVESGTVTAPGYFTDAKTRAAWERCDFIHSGWSWGINPVQEVNAATASMRAGITTLADECSYLGRNWKQQLRLQAKINREAAALGIQLAGNPADDGKDDTAAIPDEKDPPTEDIETP